MSLTARSAHGSPPWRMTTTSSGNSKQTRSRHSTRWGAAGTRGPGMPTVTKSGPPSSTQVAYSGNQAGSSNATCGNTPAVNAVAARAPWTSTASRRARVAAAPAVGFTSQEATKRSA